ncbi:hypothetical protein AURDEDRAFT_183400 [Auricularia subglabra TFB-10046 SS5]|nr:hypothetical protein AURDEDRAFT_183400 [Auricularia subglabra TFB-10046 SS5]
MATAAPSTEARPKRSPFGPTARTLRENLTAPMKYHREAVANPSLLNKSIIASARDTISDDHWAALLKSKPIVAAAKDVKLMGYSNTDAFDHAVTKLLNVISRTYLEKIYGAAKEGSAAIIFSGPDTRDVIGDYLAACSRPDMTAFVATWSLLKKALKGTRKKPFKSRQEFIDIIGLGEWKPKKLLDIKGQLLWYVSALNRYRPDLDTVYGIYIVANTIRVLSHTACGTTESPSVALDHVETWVAFVVHLYHAHLSRDASFSPAARNVDRRARWSVTTSQNAPAIFRPFHAGPSPGRVTWLSFEQDAASPQLASGFLKVSWQDASARFNEPDLLERAHKGGWLPGLVRHWSARRVTSRTVSLGASERVQEIVHLASIGDPLSQCRSALHLLKVVFDAIGVHENLLGEDIIHRDLSWFNLLCNPRHDPATEKIKPVKSGVPSIDFILTGNPSEPCALVLDLDHGAVMTELYSEKYEPRSKKSGTPMFAAVELSSAIPEATGSVTVELLARLAAFDKLPEAWRSRAFPGDEGRFMSVFNQIFELESLRLGPRHEHHRAMTDPSSYHRPRHDMESLYWIVVWALLRASPLLEGPAGLARDVALSGPANVLLSHKLGINERGRTAILQNPPTECMHDVLSSRFGELLVDMATYIRIPWHLYEGKIEKLAPNHVHIAFRRMLLVKIYELWEKNAAKDVMFNRKKPRSIRDESNFGQDLGSRPSRSAGTPYSPAPSSTPASSGPSQSLAVQLGGSDKSMRPLSFAGIESQRGSKRSITDRDSEALDLDDSQPSAKRLRIASASAAAEPADGEEHPAEQPEPAAQLDAGEQEDDPRSIDRLVQAFWDDRILWFGAGKHRRQLTEELPESSHDSSEDEADEAPADDAPAAQTDDAAEAEDSINDPAA